MLKAGHRRLQQARLVRPLRSPKQRISPEKRKPVAVPWSKREEVALVQFITLFSELKSGEWPTFGAQHEYWNKAADFVQETVGSAHKRTSKTMFPSLCNEKQNKPLILECMVLICLFVI